MAAKLQVVEPAPFEIEYGVPLPPFARVKKTGAGSAAIRALAAASIGASVFLPGFARGGVAGAASRVGRRWAATREVPGGCRVWKIAEPKAR